MSLVGGQLKMKIGLICFTLLVTLFRVVGVTGASITPGNVALDNGNRLQLHCHDSPDANISWYSPWSQRIATNDIVIDLRYRVKYDRKQGISTLILDTTDKSVGGAFKCQIEAPGQRAQERVAEVIILDSSQLQCSQGQRTFAEDETLNLTCEVGFQGNLDPVLDWSATAVNSLEVLNETTLTNDLKLSKYRLVSKAHRGLHGSTFTCTGRFEQPKNQMPGHASNTPTFDFLSCQIPGVNIQWPPTTDRISINPETGTYVKGQRVRCSADTNPHPNKINWKDSEGHIISNTTDFFVLGAPGDYHYLCVASNVVGKEVMSANRSLRFTVDTTASNALRLRASWPILSQLLSIGISCFWKMMM